MKRVSKHCTYFLSINMLWNLYVNSARALPVRTQEFTQVRQIVMLTISASCLSFIYCQCLDFMSKWWKKGNLRLLKLTSCSEISKSELSTDTSQRDTRYLCLARQQSNAECQNLSGMSRRNAVLWKWPLQAPFPNLQCLVHINKIIKKKQQLHFIRPIKKLHKDSIVISMQDSTVEQTCLARGQWLPLQTSYPMYN